jgi:putative lipoprotein
MGALIIALGDICLAGGDRTDRWFGSDKIQHFGYSAFLSGGSAIIANRHFDRGDDDSIFIGIGISVSLGAAKEVIDYNRPGQTSSIKDFIWDIAGAITGSLLASLTL